MSWFGDALEESVVKARDLSTAVRQGLYRGCFAIAYHGSILIQIGCRHSHEQGKE